MKVSPSYEYIFHRQETAQWEINILQNKHPSIHTHCINRKNLFTADFREVFGNNITKVLMKLELDTVV